MAIFNPECSSTRFWHRSAGSLHRYSWGNVAPSSSPNPRAFLPVGSCCPRTTIPLPCPTNAPWQKDQPLAWQSPATGMATQR